MTRMTPLVILLVESQRTKSASLANAMRKAGFRVEVAHTGKQALAFIETIMPAVVVFDATHMRSNGSRSCRRLRQRLDDVPLIHCRAATHELDESAEADVYLKMPFTPRKVLNRVRAMLPADDDEDQIIRKGDIVVYLGKRSVMVGDSGEHSLTPKMLGLLQEFLTHPNQIISRKHLMEQVWKTSYVGDTRTLDVHIRWLREIVEENPAKPKRLKTMRGKGYLFLLPEESLAAG